MNVIFISHRSTDAAVADMLVDYLVACGIPKDRFFCSSLPGNDVDSFISGEVKKNLKRAILNILILSNDYYNSAYCLNEAGIAWYSEEETPVIVIGLPEIDHEKMYGFIDKNHILRRLDNDTDISHIYDIVQDMIGSPTMKHTTLTQEGIKLKERYLRYTTERKVQKNKKAQGRTDEYSMPDPVPAGTLYWPRASSGKSEQPIDTVPSFLRRKKEN